MTTREARSSSVDTMTTWDEFLQQNLDSSQPLHAQAHAQFGGRKASSGKSSQHVVGDQRRNIPTSSSFQLTSSSAIISKNPSKEFSSSSTTSTGSPHRLEESLGPEQVTWSDSQEAYLPSGRPKSVTLHLKEQLPRKDRSKVMSNLNFSFGFYSNQICN